MQPQDDTPPTPDDESRVSPRPAPEDDRPTHERLESRRIPPHGDVSPDGRRVWPQPSRGAKWLVWGGTALTAAALTAGMVIAARQLLASSAERPKPPRRRDAPAPRFAGSDRPEPQARRPQPQRRAPPPSLMQEIEANTASLTNGVENVMQAASAAVTGFRDVAGQAGAILREFGDAAALARDILGRSRPKAPPRDQPPRPDDRHGAHMPDLRDDPLLHDPMEGPDRDTPTDPDPRLHRL